MGLHDIEWEIEGFEDPLEGMHPSKRKALLRDNDINTNLGHTEGKPTWSITKNIVWFLGLVLSFLWAVPFSLLLIPLILIPGVGWILAPSVWVIGVAPVTALIHVKLDSK